MIVPTVLALAATVSVPLDHLAAGSPRADLGWEFGAPFDPSKPTVLYVADGQQFRARSQSFAQLGLTSHGRQLHR